MAWYYGTFSCGHEGRVNVIGPHKDRQWKIDNKFSGICEECYKNKLQKEREYANQKALERAKEMELPELQGTEKQVAWANTLRDKFVNKIEELIKDIETDKYTYEEYKENIFKIKNKSKEETINIIKEKIYSLTDYALENEVDAKFWIDTRNKCIDSFIEMLITLYKDNQDNEEEVIKQEILLENTIRPVEVKHQGIVELVAREDKIKIYYEKNDSFIKIVKGLRYKWNGVWERNITELTGDYKDRAAELANKLLAEGFAVSIDDEEVKRKAINGDFEEECDRWIIVSQDGEKLRIKDYNNEDKIYKAAKRLPTARWKDRGIEVKIEYYKEVLEFVEMFNFKLSSKAKKLIENYEEKLSKIEVVEVKKVGKTPEKDGLQEILNSSREILDDLKEED